MSDYQMVPYEKLTAPSAINAREADGYNDVSDLVATIAAKGLLQPLIVRPVGKGRFEVMGGKRRFLAIGQIVESGQWPKSQPVPVNVRDEDDEQALETSLIENIARKPMHPVQEFEVFARLHNDGADIEAIAKRYGITTAIVRQRLALGSLSIEILEAWRGGSINADVAQAFAACPDKKQQSAAYKKLIKDGFMSAHRVRAHFVKDRPSINDARVAFVGIERYKAAGGKVVESLFDGDGYLEDEALLQKLTNERLVERCNELLADGWSFAVLASELPSNIQWSWKKLDSTPVYPTKERARVKELKAAIAKLEDADEYDDDAYNLLSDELEALETAAQLRGFTKEQKAQSGCVVAVDRIMVGLVRPGKTPAAKAGTKAAAGGGLDSQGDEDTGAAVSQAVLADITSLQTTAVAEALAQYPAIAVRVAAAALAPRVQGYYGTSPVRLTADGMTKHASAAGGDDDEDDDSDEDAANALNGFAKAFASITTTQAAAVLAVNLGRALDLRQLKHCTPEQSGTDALIGALPGAAYLKSMRALFNPSDYFARVPVKVTLAAIDEMQTKDVDRTAKKGAIAALAAADARAKGWLPAELRHPDYVLAGGRKRGES